MRVALGQPPASSTTIGQLYTPAMLPSEGAEDEIRVSQLGGQWQVLQHNRPAEWFNTLDPAVARAVAIFRERRLERPHVLIVPSDDPAMLD